MLNTLITESYYYFIENEEKQSDKNKEKEAFIDTLANSYLASKQAFQDKFGYNHPAIAGTIGGAATGALGGGMLGGLGGAAVGATAAGLGMLGLDNDIGFGDALSTGAEYGAGIGALGAGALGAYGGKLIDQRKEPLGYPRTI